jgi:hypothetical protein
LRELKMDLPHIEQGEGKSRRSKPPIHIEVFSLGVSRRNPICMARTHTLVQGNS